MTAPVVAAATASAAGSGSIVAIAFNDTITLGSAILIGVAAITTAVVAVMRFSRSSWRDQAEGLEKELSKERQERIVEQNEHAAELAGYEKRSDLLREQLLAERQKNHTLEKAADIVKLVDEQRAGNAQIVQAVQSLADAQMKTVIEAVGKMLDPSERRQQLGIDQALAEARAGHEQVMERMAASEERILSLLAEVAKDQATVTKDQATTSRLLAQIAERLNGKGTT